MLQLLAFELAFKLDEQETTLKVGVSANRLLKNHLLDDSSAEQHLERSIELPPTQTDVFHLGVLKHRKGNRDKAVQCCQYAQYAAQVGGELGQVAQQHLGRFKRNR